MNDTSARVPSNPRWVDPTLLLGSVVMLASLTWLVWTFWARYPPSLPRLTPMAGTIQTIAFHDGKRGREMEMTIEEHGRVQQLGLEQAERLPVLDWPLESLRPGDHVVAWTVADPNKQQEVWQLQMRRRRVVSYEERAAARGAELRPALIFGFVGLVTGTALVTAALVRRRRTTEHRHRLRTAM
jgi:hypothetical protein